MKLVLMNSCVMPQEGTYNCQKITRPTFVDYVIEYKRNLDSYIGYPQTANMIEKLTGVKIEVSRRPTVLQNGQRILVIKLKYRIQNSGEKSHNIHGQKIEDYEYYEICYNSIE